MSLHPLRIALLHAAVTLTAVPMESVLNRVLMQELGLGALPTAILLSIPFLLAPYTLWLGPIYDRRLAKGRGSAPLMALGYLALALAVVLAPHGAALFHKSALAGWGALTALMTLWGLGFHTATVGYFTVASRGRGPGKGPVVAAMFVVMVAAIIPTSLLTARALDPFSFAAMNRTFAVVAAVALAVALVVLPFLERGLPPGEEGPATATPSPWTLLRQGPHTRFFLYLLFLLSALLGQDLMLEPCGVPRKRWRRVC
jgi:BCD family chlorophyll transporter-like MFS transporter